MSRHTDTFYEKVADLVQKGMTRTEIATALGATECQITRAACYARSIGYLAPVRGNAVLWVRGNRMIGALEVGSMDMLIEAVGIDTIKVVVKELPKGVPLAVYLAGIIKDAMSDDDAL